MIFYFQVDETPMHVELTNINQIAVLNYIESHAPCYVNEIAKSLGISQRDVHYYLSGLRKLGIPILGGSAGEYLS